MSKTEQITDYCIVPTKENFNEWIQYLMGLKEEIDVTNPLAGIFPSDVLNHIPIDK